MTTFGQYANETSSVNLEPGMYPAMIHTADLVLEEGTPKVTENGKNLVDVVFVVDRENKPRRRYTISFGQNKSNGQWSAFAKFLEAATGLKCGDKAQRTITAEQLTGKTVRIVVAENDRGYMDVQNVLPPGKKPQEAQKTQPMTPEPDDDFAGLLD